MTKPTPPFFQIDTLAQGKMRRITRVRNCLIRSSKENQTRLFTVPYVRKKSARICNATSQHRINRQPLLGDLELYEHESFVLKRWFVSHRVRQFASPAKLT